MRDDRELMRAIGDRGLFVDSNGALNTKQALQVMERFARDFGVLWHEEPVSSDDLEGLQLLRQRAPAITEIAAGEYSLKDMQSGDQQRITRQELFEKIGNKNSCAHL